MPGATSAPAGRPATAAIDLRRVRGERTRARILDAAHELFVQHGVGPVALRDIAARAGLSHPGLQRHFASKDAVLDALVDRIEAESRFDGDVGRFDPARLVAQAERNAAVPGYLELFTRLAGAGTSPNHPAHERFAARYRGIVDVFATVYARSDAPAGLEPVAEARRQVAVWDGFQLLALHAPGRLDVPRAIARHVASLDGPAPAAAPRLPRELVPLRSILVPDAGYAPGRAQRARIVADAAARFARTGYYGASLRELAADAGIPKSTLLHHFRSKEALLTAVLESRDRDIVEDAGSETATAREAFARIRPSAEHAQQERGGLIRLYVLMAAESTSAEHPAHAYFERRFASSLDFFGSLFDRVAAEDGLDLDSDFEALRLVALWEGLQLQWCYDPALDVGALLELHLGVVLGAPGAAGILSST
ncbi:TetR/AcrR family transcriptional regulator [Agromyces seonyuensis]|uniref:TetR family transcriptional regulator n=1 Tax=Agromyces seonyuensis TaxID=2662446 RepID=A0A6I4NTT5_9MICO|nr:TetR/AcrR family transcriptional regulator [Agromyces seonyuensis]MWB97856.1 TetR family transcriptional regulator [Agromyces seonyuensis]